MREKYSIRSTTFKNSNKLRQIIVVISAQIDVTVTDSTGFNPLVFVSGIHNFM